MLKEKRSKNIVSVHLVVKFWLMANFVFIMVLYLKTSTVNYHTTVLLEESFSNAC